ncbi:MAG TPA: glycosyltransferase family 1 protein [Polyangiaceae bacterium]|nr:glycosyltransferase family 1 protein [Polyangiaceae bacterium]
MTQSRMTDKKRLLLDLTPLTTPGGARGIGRYTRELARGLTELPKEALDGIELLGLTSLTWSGKGTVVSDIAAFLAQDRTALLTTSDYYSWAYRQRLVLWLAAKHVQATALHVCDPHATPRLLGLAGTKKIVTCHDLVPTRFPDHYLGVRDGGAAIGKWIEGQRYRSADLVIAVSDATKRDVCSLLGVPEQRIRRVYNGVDLERWTATARHSAPVVLEQYGLATHPYALYVGGSDWRKNVANMMHAIAKVRASGLPLQLAWAGHLEPGHRARVEAMAAEAGVTEAVRFLGFVEDETLAVLYRGALAHLFVSRLEGFGLTVVEAMASGCPVITTQAGSLAEVAGDAAITVDPDSPEEMALALQRMQADSTLRDSLIERGKARATLFSRYEQAKATAAVYREFLLA